MEVASIQNLGSITSDEGNFEEGAESVVMAPVQLIGDHLQHSALNTMSSTTSNISAILSNDNKLLVNSVPPSETSSVRFNNESCNLILTAILNIQAKVHQLELANSVYDQEANILRHSLDKLHRDFDAFREREEAKSQEKLKQLRIDFEALYQEEQKRNDIINGLEDANRKLLANMEEGKKKEDELKAKRATMNELLQTLQQENEQAIKSIGIQKKRHTDLSMHLCDMRQKHEAELFEMQHQISAAEESLAQQCIRRNKLAAQISPMEGFADQILALHTALVNRLTGNSQGKATKKLLHDTETSLQTGVMITSSSSFGDKCTVDDVSEVIRKLQILRVRPTTTEHLLRLNDLYGIVKEKLFLSLGESSDHV